MKRIILSILVITSLSSCYAQEHQGFNLTLDKFISKQLRRQKVTGLSVALMIDENLVLSKGYGYSNKEESITANENTLYAIGSISKIVTSTAVLKLYNDGLIDIDELYTKYVPEFTMKQHFGEEAQFTIRHLLSHFAGLPRLHAKAFMTKDERPLSRLLDISQENYKISKPGVVKQYSDWGTDLLGILVEKVTQQKFQDFVNSNLFEPLEMKNSGYGIPKTQSYVKGSPTPTYEHSYPSSDGVKATALDVMNLGQMYLNEGEFNGKPFLSQIISKEAFSPQFTDASLNFGNDQGFMWDIRRYKNYTRISKGGIHEPFFSMLYVIPEFNMTLAICSNSNSSGSIHNEIYSKVLDYLRKVKEGQPTGLVNAKMVPEALSESNMQKLVGTYSTDDGIVDIKRNKDKFKVTFDAQGKTVIGIPYANKTMRIKIKLLGLIPIHVMDIFWDEVNGEIVVGEQYSNGRRSLGGIKMVKKPIPENWTKAIGKYKLSNRDSKAYTSLEEIELVMNKYGFLELRGNAIYPRKFKIKLPLNPISQNLSTVPGYSFELFAGETIELSEINGKSVITFSGYQMTKMD